MTSTRKCTQNVICNHWILNYCYLETLGVAQRCKSNKQMYSYYYRHFMTMMSL